MSTHVEEHEEEESYFVSMTDIMVGLLFIFIILLMYLVLQLREAPSVALVPAMELQKVRAELASAEQRITSLMEQLKQLRRDRIADYVKAADAKRAEILRQLRDSLAAQNVPVEIVEEQGILRLVADLLFERGRSE